MKTILDYGAGFQALHTTRLRSLGLDIDVTAHDFGRNFVPGLHDKRALEFEYDLVFASNVLNVHISYHALLRTVGEIALCTRGVALLNYPQTPRKGDFGSGVIEETLEHFFCDVERVAANYSGMIWKCARRTSFTMQPPFTKEQIEDATIRPSGAVGRNAIVPRIVEEMLKPETREADWQATRAAWGLVQDD